MIAVIARLNVKEGQEAALESLMGELAAQVEANEPGCKLYQLCKGSQPRRYVMIERYDDQDALTAHSRSDHFRANMGKLGSLLEENPAIEVLTEI